MGQLQDVHMDQLKPCVWDMEVLKGDPLLYKEGEIIPYFDEDPLFAKFWTIG